jgi:putative protease
LSEAACLRRLAAISPERISCNVSLALAGDVLTVSGTTDDLSCEVAFPVGPLEPARGERAAEALKARFAETGDSPFALAAFDAERFGDRFIPPSRLKEVRRTFYKAFERVVADRREAERQQARAAARVAISTQPRGPGGGAGKIWVGVESPDDVPTLDRPGIEGFLVPLGRAAVGALAESMAPLAAFPERIVWRLPFWMPDDAVAVADAVARLLAAGFRGFEANNPAHFRMLEGKGARVVAGWRTGGTNSLSLRSLRAQGAAAATLSPEDDGVNVEALLRAALPVERWMTVYGRLPMMASRIRVRRAEKPTTLSAEGGERFEVSTEDGLTVLRSASPFSLTGRLARLRAEGCDAFVVELAGLAKDARDAVLEAAFSDGPMPGASAVNFDREQRA